MNTSEEVYRYLREEILSLALLPGSEIRLQDIEEKLEVSKSPIRAALRDLRFENLVDIVPQSGTQVSRIDISLVEEQRFIRTYLENGIVHRFCQNKDNQEALLGMAHCIAQQKAFAKSEKLNEFLAADDAFHEWIYKSVGYSRVWNLVQSQSGHYHRIRLLTFMDSLYRPEIIEEHEEMLKALRKRDEEAVAAVSNKHINTLDMTKITVIKRNPEYFTGYDQSNLL